MNYVYPVINGKKEKHKFYSDWDEVPLPAFIEFQSKAEELTAMDDQINSENDKILKLTDQYAKYIFGEHKHMAPKVLKKIKRVQKVVDKMLLKRQSLEAYLISQFCSVPEEVLVEMEYGNLNQPETWNDNTFARYRTYFMVMVTVPTPTQAISSFRFQSKTDEEIKELEPTGISIFNREAKRIYNDAKNREFSIKNLWEQTTIINKHLQEMANDIIEEMKIGEFGGLADLIAMMSIEGDEPKELLDLKHGNKPYVEAYMAEYKKILDHRKKVFFEQKKKISTGTAIKVKNFFLTN